MMGIHRRRKSAENGAARFPRWLLGFGIGIPVALILLAASPLGTNYVYVMMGMPFLLAVWGGTGIAAAVLAVNAARAGAWITCGIASLLPLALVFVAFDIFRFIAFCNYSGDLLHFILLRPSYDRQIAALSDDQRPRVVVFNFGGMVWASRGVVYDETDQVALPRGEQSADWLQQASRNELSCRGYSVQPLWSHYYLGEFPC